MFTWIAIEKGKMPQREILAANFAPGTYGYREKLIGYLSYNSTERYYICDSSDEQLQHCTHYIDIHAHDNNIQQ